MRISRAKWLWAAVLSSALLVGGPTAALHGQNKPEQQTQLATIEQLKHEAFKALRGGNFDRSDELIRAAASMSSDDRALAQMSQWIAQYNSQRTEFVAERKKQYDDVVADVQKLLDGKKDVFAIDKATEAFTLTSDKDSFPKEPWVASLLQRAATIGADYEAGDQWIKARRIWSDLAAIEPANPKWKEKLNAANRRARLLAMYAPDDLTAMFEADAKDRREAEALLKGPSTQPTTAPTTKPLAQNDDFKIDWHDTLKGVRKDMLDDALDEAKSNYWKDVNYRTLLTGGLKGVQALITTKGLEKTFPTLADKTKRDAFAAVIDQNLQTVANLQKPEDEQFAVRRIVSGLRLSNRQTLQLPDEVLINEFADGAFVDLDQFTNMIWPSEVEEFNKTTQGEFGGVGIQINNDDEGNLKVVSPVEDTPAYKLGVKAGDIITRINGKNAKGITTTQAVKNITGSPGTEVTLTIRSGIDGTEKDYTIRRERINVASVKGWKRVPGAVPTWDYFIDPQQKIAYLRLTNFTKHSYDEMRKALYEAKEKGARGLILDMRYNPGGLLVSATEISDKFLSSGTIVSTRADRENAAQTPTSSEAKASADDCDLPMVVLVNQYSASASEIVAGALKDHHRATIVGERTFGKGSVQMLFPLAGRTAYLKLTTSHYYLPSGRCLHREENSTTWGVDPDVLIEMTPKQMGEAIEARQDQEVIRDLDGTPVPATQPSTQPAKPKKDILASDSQLSTALLVMRLQLAGASL
ncbi:hypothetical protein BH09PLA1_BH09PLA1_18440 [soil metagenome]